MTPYRHVAQVMDAVRDGLVAWAGGLLREGGLDLPVTGASPRQGGPALVLLPYQLVMESQSTTPSMSLVPQASEAQRDAVPPVWRTIGRVMTATILDRFPTRPPKGPGVGSLDPVPPLAALPAPIAAWYQARGEPWVVQRQGEPAARLPSVSWRQPFSLAVRYAAFVNEPEPGGHDRVDALRLQALALIAAGVRLQRFVRVRAPGDPMDEALVSLIRAFAAVGGDDAGLLGEALDAVLAERDLAVGLTPHHDLSDADVARVNLALGQPMQAALVFSVRLALGAGPELGPGALPHLGSVTGTST